MEIKMCWLPAPAKEPIPFPSFHSHPVSLVLVYRVRCWTGRLFFPASVIKATLSGGGSEEECTKWQ